MTIGKIAITIAQEFYLWSMESTSSDKEGFCTGSGTNCLNESGLEELLFFLVFGITSFLLECLQKFQIHIEKRFFFLIFKL